MSTAEKITLYAAFPQGNHAPRLASSSRMFEGPSICSCLKSNAFVREFPEYRLFWSGFYKPCAHGVCLARSMLRLIEVRNDNSRCRFEGFRL